MPNPCRSVPLFFLEELEPQSTYAVLLLVLYDRGSLDTTLLFYYFHPPGGGR